MNILLVSSEDGDWHGIYVDGVLKDEGHELIPRMILDALGVEYTSIEHDLEPWGRCPTDPGELNV